MYIVLVPCTFNMIYYNIHTYDLVQKYTRYIYARTHTTYIHHTYSRTLYYVLCTLYIVLCTMYILVEYLVHSTCTYLYDVHSIHRTCTSYLYLVLVRCTYVLCTSTMYKALSLYIFKYCVETLGGEWYKVYCP